ncbi:hypothetical protein HYFRA_00007118 [Hymenoscyphus fraxineus]|uniref:Uncharacterized protein n=1 Tax=Hymenoscyphus fraxineus TaxID=746836 RepID=A0A9N9PU07_9HELO|nr:hypothetical protein HYFRA_00007118 [Hymenoscyphus fraxineus]
MWLDTAEDVKRERGSPESQQRLDVVVVQKWKPRGLVARKEQAWKGLAEWPSGRVADEQSSRAGAGARLRRSVVNLTLCAIARWTSLMRRWMMPGETGPVRGEVLGCPGPSPGIGDFYCTGTVLATKAEVV